MTYPRRMSVSLESTPYYHMVSRCVRRAWLWGVDKYTGKDYSHRKGWVLERLSQLCAVFAVDCMVYAVMSNHYHLGLRVDVDRARGWSDAEVVERWTRLFRKPILIERWLNGTGGEAERAAALEIIKEWRSRLQDPSWFMKNMNELRDFPVEAHPISQVGDHHLRSLAEPKATIFTPCVSCWQVCEP